MMVFTQIFVPKRCGEPFRNVKNYGLLMDLHKIFNEQKASILPSQA